MMVAQTLSAQNKSSVFDLLSTPAEAGIESARKVMLRLPMDSIYAKSGHQQQAVISFTDDTGREFRRPLQVGVRGKFRRRTCTFPPLKLNFSKKQLRADGLSTHDKLKLVTPCFEDEAGQALIMKEYLAYKLYEQISPAAFRTQLLEITYRDINRQHPDQTVFAFVLEDSDELAERLGGVELENGRGLAPDRFDRRAETTQALFSYFIGNLDWNLAMSRNIKMVKLENEQIIPVPYDFDFSYMVGAPYMRLDASAGQKRAEQRVYMGLLCNDDLLSEVYATFELKRKEMSKMVRSFHLLDLDNRTKVANYLAGFFSEFRRMQRWADHHPEGSLYVRLRAEQVDVIPPGAKPAYYGVSK